MALIAASVTCYSACYARHARVSSGNWETGDRPRFPEEIRSTANGGFALGNKRFKAQIAAMLARRVEPGAPGRPKKEKPKLSEPEIRAG